MDLYDDHQAEVNKKEIEDAFEDASEEEVLEEIDSAPKIVSREKEDKVESVLIESRVKRGETLERFFRRNKLSKDERGKVIKAIHQYFSPRLIMPGHRFFFKRVKSEDKGQGSTLEKVIFIISSTRKLVIQRNSDGAFYAKAPQSLTRRFDYMRGTVTDNLYMSGMRSGLNVSLVNQLIRIYSYSVDFQRDLKANDTFEVVAEKFYDAETGYESSGEVLYSSLFLKGGAMKLYRYAMADGSTEYFNEKGEGARKALLSTPIKGARISSGYGKRRHPILGYTKMHRGIDFAAPRGTPVFAAGDGVVRKFGRLGGYGNYVFIKHSPEYGTAYAHLSRYAKNLKRGKKVKQGDVIGYVGATGRATAPHLHYEIHYKGKQINPRSVKMSPQKHFAGKELEKFLSYIKKLEAKAENLKNASESQD